ncbi:MAG TPA: glycosyltransferase family 87 protein [Candidatus Acidoferrum sp.]|nr:glycosyltransferase family 87 protein [Candidatus Acidoferrum sp.]
MLSSGNYSTDQKRFLFLSLASLILCILIVSRLLALTPVEVILLLAFLLRLHQPLLADLRMGNVNQLQLLPIALFIFALARSKPLLAGSVMGVATAFKPTTILVLAFGFLVFLIDRDYRQSARMLVGSATAVLAAILFSGFYFGTSSVWFAFFHSLRNTLNGSAYSLENGNFSLSVLLFGPTSRSSTIVPVVLLSAFLWLLIASRRSDRTATVSEQDSSRIRFHSAFCVGGGGCAIMLLSSPLAWIHYYVLLLPLSLYVISPACSIGFPGFTENGWLSKVVGVALRYAPLFVFSLLFNALVGDRPKTICVGLITATFVTLALSAHQLWRQRCPVSLVAPETGSRL